MDAEFKYLHYFVHSSHLLYHKTEYKRESLWEGCIRKGNIIFKVITYISMILIN